MRALLSTACHVCITCLTMSTKPQLNIQIVVTSVSLHLALDARRLDRLVVAFSSETASLFFALHTVPDVSVFSGDRHEVATIKFNPFSRHVCARGVRVLDQSAKRVLRGACTHVQAEKEAVFLRIRLHIISKSNPPSGSDRRGAGGTYSQVSAYREVQVLRTSWFCSRCVPTT